MTTVLYAVDGLCNDLHTHCIADKMCFGAYDVV